MVNCPAAFPPSMPLEDRDGRGHITSNRTHHLFAVPAPIKRIFDHFPLVTLSPNDLPQRSNTTRQGNKLYVFSDPVSAKRGRPSFNPQCLKWQAYLKFAGIELEIIPSNNHASPTGSLPFLIPGTPVRTDTPIPSNKLQKWAIEEVHCEEEQQLNIRFEVYSSLLDCRIRNAWLYTLYLDSENFDAVARRLYVDPVTASPVVRAALAAQLQRAARDELLKVSQYIDASGLIAEAGNAFQALSELLDDQLYFFGRPKPGLFDAEVFAYTHLILDEDMGWAHNAMGQLLKGHQNLVQHRERLLAHF